MKKIETRDGRLGSITSLVARIARSLVSAIPRLRQKFSRRSERRNGARNGPEQEQQILAPDTAMGVFLGEVGHRPRL